MLNGGEKSTKQNYISIYSDVKESVPRGTCDKRKQKRQLLLEWLGAKELLLENVF